MIGYRKLTAFFSMLVAVVLLHLYGKLTTDHVASIFDSLIIAFFTANAAKPAVAGVVEAVKRKLGAP